jgi:hypothetical protein
MEYSQTFSPQALNYLEHIHQPSNDELNKCMNGPYGWSPCTPFEWISKNTDRSPHSLRRTIRNELYGIAWVIFYTKDISYSHNIEKFDIHWVSNLPVRNDPNSAHRIAYLSDWTRVEVKRTTRPTQEGLYIPPVLQDSYKEMVGWKSNTLTISLQDESLEVLRYVSQRTHELREKYWQNWYPPFTEKEISDNTWLTRIGVRESANACLWLLAESRELKQARHMQRKYFLPKSKFNFIKTMTEKNSGN